MVVMSFRAREESLAAISIRAGGGKRAGNAGTGGGSLAPLGMTNYGVLARAGPRSTCPGSAPVSTPLRITGTPFTTT
jgi:hypothetical protein